MSKDIAPTWGTTTQKFPRPRQEGWGAWGGSQSSPMLTINWCFVLFFYKMLFSTPANLGPDIWSHTVLEVYVALLEGPDSENCGWKVTMPSQPPMR